MHVPEVTRHVSFLPFVLQSPLSVWLTDFKGDTTTLITHHRNLPLLDECMGGGWSFSKLRQKFPLLQLYTGLAPVLLLLPPLGEVAAALKVLQDPLQHQLVTRGGVWKMAVQDPVPQAVQVPIPQAVQVPVPQAVHVPVPQAVHVPVSQAVQSPLGQGVVLGGLTPPAAGTATAAAVGVGGGMEAGSSSSSTMGVVVAVQAAMLGLGATEGAVAGEGTSAATVLLAATTTTACSTEQAAVSAAAAATAVQAAAGAALEAGAVAMKSASAGSAQCVTSSAKCQQSLMTDHLSVPAAEDLPDSDTATASAAAAADGGGAAAAATAEGGGGSGYNAAADAEVAQKGFRAASWHEALPKGLGEWSFKLDSVITWLRQDAAVGMYMVKEMMQQGQVLMLPLALLEEQQQGKKQKQQQEGVQQQEKEREQQLPPQQELEQAQQQKDEEEEVCRKVSSCAVVCTGWVSGLSEAWDVV